MSSYEVLRFETEADWLEARVCTGGLVAHLLGNAKYGSTWNEWARLTKHETYKSVERTWAMERGHILEMPLAEKVCKDIGVDDDNLYHSNNEVWRTKGREWETCSPDVIVCDGFISMASAPQSPSDMLEVWEIKSRGGNTVRSIEQTDFPPYELDQLRWTMKILGVDTGRLCIEATDGVAVMEIHRDPEWENRAESLVEDFYRVHVVGGKPPLIDGSEACTEALRASQDKSDDYLDLSSPLPPEKDGLPVISLVAAEAKVAALKSTSAEIKALKAEESRLKNEVLEILDGKKGLRCELGTIFNTSRKASPNWKRISADLKAHVNEDVYEQLVAAHTADTSYEYLTCRWK